MIASLRGVVVDKGTDHVVIECGGVGYLCQATARTLSGLPLGDQAFVLTTMVVREDSQTLYAFPDASSRELFTLVQSVSGVGARMAMALLSVLTPGEIATAVADGDVKALQRAPGVGKRLADRMAVDLRGKLDAYLEAGSTATAAPAATAADAAEVPDSAVAARVIEALVGLGFPDSEATDVVATLIRDDSEADSEDAAGGGHGDGTASGQDASVLLRRALSALGGPR